MSSIQERNDNGKNLNSRPLKGRALRSAGVAMAVIGLIVTSCAGPATAPVGVQIPVEPISIDIPALDVDLGLCVATISLPAVVIDGLIFQIPEISVDPDNGVISLPEVGLYSPARSETISGIQASCFGLPPADITMVLTVPEIVAGGAITIDFENNVIVIDDLEFAITGGQVRIPELGNLQLPLPEVSIPLDGITVPF